MRPTVVKTYVPGSFIEDGYTRELAKLSVERGWHELLDIVFDLKPKETTIVQVKEKYGYLRIYVHKPTLRFSTILSECEEKSEKICELCGLPGTLSKEGYTYMTRCENHKGMISND